MPHFHVSNVLNRASIDEHGLDWTYMGAARGIAGSYQPEVDGVFLCHDRWMADWFVGFTRTTRALVDIWEVSGVNHEQLLDNGTGYFYLQAKVPRDQITLVAGDLTAPPLE